MLIYTDYNKAIGHLQKAVEIVSDAHTTWRRGDNPHTIGAVHEVIQALLTLGVCPAKIQEVVQRRPWEIKHHDN